jgi:hypothetical protein
MREWIDLVEGTQDGCLAMLRRDLIEGTILVNQPSNPALQDFYSDKEETLGFLVSAYKSGQHNRWRVVPANLLLTTWRNWQKLGFVRSEKAINVIADRFRKNTILIAINNEISGHESVDPKTMLDEYFSEDEMEAFVDWAIECETGWRISDYGIDRLIKYSCLLDDASSPEEKLLLCDAILNVTHQRSDLASWFVEGGTRTMSELSNDTE